MRSIKFTIFLFLSVLYFVCCSPTTESRVPSGSAVIPQKESSASSPDKNPSHESPPSAPPHTGQQAPPNTAGNQQPRANMPAPPNMAHNLPSPAHRISPLDSATQKALSESVTQVVNNNTELFVQCDRYLFLETNIKLDLTVDAGGYMRDVKILENPTGNQKLADCVIEAFKSLRYPNELKEGVFIMQYILNFKPYLGNSEYT